MSILKKFKPVFTAVDEILFGTDKVTILPHIVDHMDLKRYMSFVILALIPAVIASVYFWGYRVLLLIAVSYTFGGIVEVLFAVVRKKEIHEGFLVTGLIFPLILPPNIPLWMAALGVMFGVMFGKEVFGGTGRNIFNPAIVGRVFLSVAFPKELTTDWLLPFNQGLGGWLRFSPDAMTQATPLSLFKNGGVTGNWQELFLGAGPGCVGETFRVGIVLGGLFLVATKISNWRLPLSAILSLAFFSLAGSHLYPQKVAPFLFQLASGGFLLGVFFMLTDPVTSPFTRAGKWIGGILFGFLVVLIRGFSGYVEGVMFSILLVNVFAPLIDHLALSLKYPKIGK